MFRCCILNHESWAPSCACAYPSYLSWSRIFSSFRGSRKFIAVFTNNHSLAPSLNPSQSSLFLSSNCPAQITFFGKSLIFKVKTRPLHNRSSKVKNRHKTLQNIMSIWARCWTRYNANRSRVELDCGPIRVNPAQPLTLCFTVIHKKVH
jgi:hypothetical protein